MWFKLFLIHFFLILLTVCGESKSLDEKHLRDASNEKAEAYDSNAGTCTNVIISDRYALTAAHCFEGQGL